MRSLRSIVPSVCLLLALAACGGTSGEEAAALAAFVDIETVFQHPRCRNCHIDGNAPLQFDAGVVHSMEVVRGEEGMGAPGLRCYACHGEQNLPASYGAEAPPGAPHWALPPADQKMAWFGLTPRELCEVIQDPEENGGRDLQALLEHVSEDALVLWGWDPGGEREPVPVPHDRFVASFTTWVEAGGPCPAN